MIGSTTMRSRIYIAVTATVTLGVALVTAAAQQTPATKSESKPPTVLFMCPHGAAKSVLASAYFQRAAQERGLNVRVISGGTEPDPQVSPKVADHLKKNGYAVPIDKPARVSDEDFKTADVVISLGCDLKGLPPTKGTLLKWDEVPPPSEDFARADAEIKRRVIELVDEMVRKQQNK